MRNSIFYVLLILPFLGFGQSYYYDFNIDGYLEGFEQGGIPSLNVTDGSLVASDNPSTFTGGFQQIRTKEGLNLVESDYTMVRLVVENLLTYSGGNHETFRIINYDAGSTNVNSSVTSSNITIPHGSGFQTLDFAIPSNPDNGGIIDRIGLRIQLNNGGALAGTLRIDQLIILNTISVDIVTNGDFEANGGDLAPWIADGSDISASLVAGNGGGSAGRATFDVAATGNNTFSNIDYVLNADEIGQIQTITVNFDAQSNNSAVTVGVQVSHSLGGGSTINQFNGNEIFTTSWQSYAINRSISDEFDTIKIALRIKNNVASAAINDYFDFDNVSATIVYYDLSVGTFPAITSAIVGNWNDTATWNGGIIPSETDNVEINHEVTINGDREARNVTVSATGRLLINKNTHSLRVFGDFTNNAGANDVVLRADSDQFSSIIVEGSATGDIRFRRFVSLGPDNDLISPPVNISSFADFYGDNTAYFIEDPNSDQVLFGPFDNSALINAYVNFDNTNTDALVQGKGYRMGTTGSEPILNFHGTIETGPVNIALTNEVGGSPWNLIGNPYSSYLNFKEFFDTLTDFDGSIVGPNNQLDTDYTALYGYNANSTGGHWTIWDFNNPNYANDNISPGQGFFVRSKSGGGSVDFTPSMRAIGDTDDFILGRTSDTNLAHACLFLTNTSNSYTTNIYFREGNTLGLDPGFDTGAYNQNGMGIYSHLVEDDNGIQLANQSLPYASLNDVVVPLVVKANQGVQFSIGLNTAVTNIPADINIYLEDIVLNTTTLLNSLDYTITPTSDINGEGRFYLRITNSALSLSESELDTIQIYNKDESIYIKGQLNTNTRFKLYDVQGRLVKTLELDAKKNNHKIDVSHIYQGIYIITLVNKNQSKTQKIVLH